jgi:thiamine phosphate synthase YjbQ (UPF0047 family)
MDRQSQMEISTKSLGNMYDLTNEVSRIGKNSELQMEIVHIFNMIFLTSHV